MGGPLGGGPLGGLGGVVALAPGQTLSQTLVSSGGSIAWNVALGGVAAITLTASDAFANPTGLVASPFPYYLTITQDSTGGWQPTWGSTWERAPRIYESANAVTLLAFRYDGTKFRILQEAPMVREIVFVARPPGDAIPASSLVWNNLPAARTEWASSTGCRHIVDLRSVVEVQLELRTGGTVVGAGAKAAGMYSVDAWVTPVFMDGGAAATPITTQQPQVPIDVATTTSVSPWTALGSSAKTATTQVSLFASGGDGATDPSFVFAVLRVR